MLCFFSNSAASMNLTYCAIKSFCWILFAGFNAMCLRAYGFVCHFSFVNEVSCCAFFFKIQQQVWTYYCAIKNGEGRRMRNSRWEMLTFRIDHWKGLVLWWLTNEILFCCKMIDQWDHFLLRLIVCLGIYYSLLLVSLNLCMFY